MKTPVVVITGGEGDLAAGLIKSFIALDYEVLSPGRSELDVTCADSIEAYFRALDELDVLVNNAGITADQLLVKQSESDWQRVIDTNLKGAHLCCRSAARLMAKQRRGHLIQIGSYSSLNPPVGQTAYAASKAGLIALTKSYAKEFGKRNIRANCVLPGFLETRMTANLSEAATAAALERHQLGRFNTIEEAARFIAFLCTTDHISGQVFQLDSRA